MKLALPDGSTVRSVAANVPAEYVRAVLENVQQCEREFGDALVSISITDKRPTPSYRIDAIMDLNTGETMNWQDFDGRTHRPLADSQKRHAVWSSERMTWRELSNLIGEIRNFQRTASKPNR